MAYSTLFFDPPTQNPLNTNIYIGVVVSFTFDVTTHNDVVISMQFCIV